MIAPLLVTVKDAMRSSESRVGEQLHRALQIGEEDRDLLALTLKCGLRGEDLLGDVSVCSSQYVMPISRTSTPVARKLVRTSRVRPRC